MGFIVIIQVREHVHAFYTVIIQVREHMHAFYAVIIQVREHVHAFYTVIIQVREHVHTFYSYTSRSAGKKSVPMLRSFKTCLPMLLSLATEA
jgi:hypothetical protein